MHIRLVPQAQLRYNVAKGTLGPSPDILFSSLMQFFHLFLPISMNNKVLQYGFPLTVKFAIFRIWLLNVMITHET